MGEKEQKSPGGVRYYRLSEIEEQNSFKSTWIIIHNKVYDVTKFLEEVSKVSAHFSPTEARRNQDASCCGTLPSQELKQSWSDRNI